MKYKGDDGIMQDLFSDNTPSVESERILYTPSTFARSSLLHLQEVGSLRQHGFKEAYGTYKVKRVSG